MSDFKIFNSFGITPSYNCEAAGLDFYVPNIHGLDDKDTILEAFCKSYEKTIDELSTILDTLSLYISAKYGPEKFDNNELNVLHLYLSLDSERLWNQSSEQEEIEEFVEHILVFDDKNNPGIYMTTGDQVLFNSGIKVHLDKDTAGIFFNKSGKGRQGFDVRAQVVDEDYAGFVHLSMAYTKRFINGVIFCGDKLTQMIVLPIIHKVPKEITEDAYNKLMDKSKRGDKGFGSSDVKH